MMHNQKKYTLTIWGFLTALVSACSQYGDPYKDVPKEVDGHPVYEVPFEQPLVIDPKKEQVFYFKLKKKPKAPETNYVVYIMVMYPINDKKYYDIDNGIIMNRTLIENKMLKFEAKLSHFDKNKIETKIGLNNKWIYYPDLLLHGNKNTPRFRSNHTQFVVETESSSPPPRIFDGEDYHVDKNEMAYFLIQETGGYYRFSIRALQRFPIYPKLKLSVYINTERTPK